jgi:hypothetical protein
MDFTIEVMEDQGIVVLTLKGEYDAHVDFAMARQITETIQVGRGHALFVDIRELRSLLPLISLFERAAELQKQGHEHGTANTKVAILLAAGEKQHEENMAFFETTSRNRGLPYRIFMDKTQALAWLMGNE